MHVALHAMRALCVQVVVRLGGVGHVYMPGIILHWHPLGCLVGSAPVKLSGGSIPSHLGKASGWAVREARC